MQCLKSNSDSGESACCSSVNSAIMWIYRAMCSRNGPPSMIIGLTHSLWHIYLGSSCCRIHSKPNQLSIPWLLTCPDNLVQIFESNCHSKFLGRKQNGGLPEHVYSNPLINCDCPTVGPLTVKYNILKTTFCLDNLYLIHAQLVIMADNESISQM